MKWYFAINEHGTTTDAAQLACFAVRSAARIPGLRPHLLYSGNRNAFTAWMEAAGVKVLDIVPSYIDAIQDAIDAGWYPRSMTGHWLRTEICNVETEDAFVLYTDIDVVFLAPPALEAAQPRFFACAPESLPDDWSSFNSGVMVMNVGALRRDYPGLRDYIIHRFRNPTGQIFNDQHIFNEYYADRWDRLDPLYNWKPYWAPRNDIRILHLHGPKFGAIRAMLDGTWDWNSDHGRQSGDIFVCHADRYMAHLRALLALADPSDPVRDDIETVLRRTPPAMEAMIAQREAAYAAAGLVPAVPSLVIARPPAALPGWQQSGPACCERMDGRAMAVRDDSRLRPLWTAAVRGLRPRPVDPLFLTDASGRLRLFTDSVSAQQAAEAALPGS